MTADAPPARLILLMKDTEAEFFGGFFHRIAPLTELRRARDETELESAAAEAKADRAPMRLIAFSTNIIASPDVLDLLRGDCINFHPGPPEYPGYRPTGFALYRGERRYGVTAHYMTERVDEGAIVAVDRYDLPPDPCLIETVKEAYQRLARLLLSLLPQLARVGEPLPPIGESWGPKKTTKAQYEAMRLIAPDMDRGEVEKRFRCFDGVYSAIPADHRAFRP